MKEEKARACAKEPLALSIIVPVYNVEGYLERSLASIQAQTFKGWECILVDDGSTDGSGPILDEWAARDERFVAIHKENGGAASARNAALKVARGKYIGFVDPDDWIEPDMYELALGAARETGADIVQWRSITERDGSFLVSPEIKEGFFDVMRNSRRSTRLLAGVVWNKLFKRSLIEENGIAFPESLQGGGDDIFSIQAYALAAKCFFLNKALYHYDVSRPTSLMKMVQRDTRQHIQAYAREVGNACRHIMERAKVAGGGARCQAGKAACGLCLYAQGQHEVMVRQRAARA